MTWPEHDEPEAGIVVRSIGMLLAVLVVAGIVAVFHGPPPQLARQQQLPVVAMSSRATSTIEVMADLIVGGFIETTGITGTAAHVHIGAAGTSGPAIITLEAQGANLWAVPAGTRLTGGQYVDFRAGNLYVDVHSTAHPGGELRLQLVGG